MAVMTRTRRLSGPTRLRTWVALGVLFVPLLTLTYSSILPGSYSATTHLAVLTGGPDALIPATPVDPSTLNRAASDLRSLVVAEGAVQRLPGLPSDATLLRRSADARRHVHVKIDVRSGELILTAQATSPAEAARLADAFASSFLRLHSAQILNLTNAAVLTANRRIAKLRPNQRAIQLAELAALRRTLDFVVADQVQLLRPASAGSRAVLPFAIAAAIAILAALAIGVWRYTVIDD